VNLDSITVSDFKSYFRRGFPYLPDDSSSYCDADKYVQDADIQKAFGEAQASFNQGLYGSDAFITQAYLYLTAHYLVKRSGKPQPQALPPPAHFR